MSKTGPRKTVRVVKERDFEPQHLLIHIARCALEDAEKKVPGWGNQQFIAIAFSALAIEAMANSFGQRLITRWVDFESSSPIAKLRIICAELKIQPDWAREPWGTVLWLVKFRNKIAHAQPESVVYDKEFPIEECSKTFHDSPPSKLEAQATLANARRAVKNTNEIHRIFLSKLKPGQHPSLFSDGFSARTANNLTRARSPRRVAPLPSAVGAESL
jgi:hypothetical protein